MSQILIMVIGGIIGGLIGYAISLVLLRMVKAQLLQSLCVAGFAFAGALLLPRLLINPSQNVQSQDSSVKEVVSSDDTNKVASVTTDQKHDQPRIMGEGLLNTLATLNDAFATRLAVELPSETTTSTERDAYAFTVGIEEALRYIPRASDERIINLIEGLALTTAELLQRAPKVCYAWHYGGFGYEDFVYTDFAQAVGPDIVSLHFQLYAVMVNSAMQTMPDYDKAAASAAVSRASFQMLQIAGANNAALVNGERGPDPQTLNKDYHTACQARLVLYQALLREENPGSAIRHLFLQ